MKSALDAIVARATGQLRREHVAEVQAARLQQGLPLLPLAAIVVLAARLGGSEMGALASIALTLFPYAYYVAIETAEACFQQIDRPEALGRVDRELGLHDRLQTADEFLRLDSRTAFMDAAIEDARPHLAEAAEVELADRGVRPEQRAAIPVMAALLILLAALQILPVPLPPPGDRGEELAVRPDETAVRKDSRPVPERSTAPIADRPRTDRPEGGAQKKESSEQGGTRDKTRRGSASTGRTARTGGAGSQARSADASGAPSAAGRASSQKLKTKPKESRPRKKKKPKSQAATPRTPPRRDSGATSGSARSSGSSKNPTASDWKTRDTPPDQAEDPEADDEEVDDESEDSKTRGGMQPNLRSRKPPVNRDLGIGFGNRASRRANGRGGASQRKKSRGTASLVLGVPVPDHIKGQPNPGMTKVTRERGDPEDEKSGSVDADARKERNAPAGAVPRAEWTPWLRELIRRYFRDEQEQDE